MKTPEEATELIENISANDHTILRDRVHQPTKKRLLNWLVVFHLGNKLVDSYLSNEEEEQEIVMNQDTPITSLGGHDDAVVGSG